MNMMTKSDTYSQRTQFILNLFLVRYFTLNSVYAQIAAATILKNHNAFFFMNIKQSKIIL